LSKSQGAQAADNEDRVTHFVWIDVGSVLKERGREVKSVVDDLSGVEIQDRKRGFEVWLWEERER
jgi:hypothetical protein